MAVMGGNTDKIIDKMVDFTASTQAFMEYLNKAPREEVTMKSVPPEKKSFYIERLNHYREIYKRR